jgi:GTP diphosphokinase / guanosine-3',5'-bis(diphosphate) 3'-diphosphatase
MNKLTLAIAITAERFINTFDKSGQPYILHCLTVMNNTEGDEDTKCAAVMHDLLEDTETKASELTGLGFSDKTIGLLHLLTHQKETDYMEYIKAISVSPEATKIKLADLKHNSDITRLKGLRKKDLDRMEKYHRAYIYLSNN